MNAADRLPGFHQARRSASLTVLGVLLAIGVPAAAITVAALWEAGLRDFHRNDPLVGTLSSLLFPGLVISPIGLLLAGAGMRVHGLWRWAAHLAVGLPLVVIVWLIAAVWLGGLTGQPV